MLEDLSCNVPRREVLTDSSAARLAIGKGFSVTLEHMKKSRRVSVAWIRDTCLTANIDLGEVDTSINLADAFTKHLAQPRVGVLYRMMNMRGPYRMLEGD